MQIPATPSLDCLLRISIPGDPVAQGRGRIVRRGLHYGIADPERSANWKGAASYFMARARREAGIDAPFARALCVTIEASWKRPKKCRPGRQWRPSRPDADNIAKAVLDAGNGVLWADDSQVVHLVVRKLIADAGTGPAVVVTLAGVGDAA